MASYFIEMIEGYTKNHPRPPVLFDDANNKGLTYSRIDEMSGKVYSYLKSNGIGKEDFVLLNLPRGIMPVIAMLGVWKAGAAWALVEDTYAPERIDYIRNDCGCKFEINAASWEEVMNCEALYGHEDVETRDGVHEKDV